MTKEEGSKDKKKTKAEHHDSNEPKNSLEELEPGFVADFEKEDYKNDKEGILTRVVRKGSFSDAIERGLKVCGTCEELGYYRPEERYLVARLKYRCAGCMAEIEKMDKHWHRRGPKNLRTVWPWPPKTNFLKMFYSNGYYEPNDTHRHKRSSKDETGDPDALDNLIGAINSNDSLAVGVSETRTEQNQSESRSKALDYPIAPSMSSIFAFPSATTNASKSTYGWSPSTLATKESVIAIKNIAVVRNDSVKKGKIDRRSNSHGPIVPHEDKKVTPGKGPPGKELQEKESRGTKPDEKKPQGTENTKVDPQVIVIEHSWKGPHGLDHSPSEQHEKGRRSSEHHKKGHHGKGRRGSEHHGKGHHESEHHGKGHHGKGHRGSEHGKEHRESEHHGKGHHGKEHHGEHQDGHRRGSHHDGHRDGHSGGKEHNEKGHKNGKRKGKSKH